MEEKKKGDNGKGRDGKGRKRKKERVRKTEKVPPTFGQSDASDLAAP